jgi:hypothetical protein
VDGSRIMIPRERWRHSIRTFLSSAPSPLRLSAILRAVDAKRNEMNQQDFSTLGQLLHINGWKKQHSRRDDEPVMWCRKARTEAGA